MYEKGKENTEASSEDQRREERRRGKKGRKEMQNPVSSSCHYEWKMKKYTRKKCSVLISSLLLLLTLLLVSTHAMPSTESDSNRRQLLWQATLERRYITYDVLKRDKVPCDNPGASYYSCHGSGEPRANPYVRGCSIIAGCRGGGP